MAANSLEDAILFVKKHDENGKIYKNYRNGIDEVGKTQIGSSENSIISIKKINKREIELDGIT
ncbi:MAG: hypothetical protein MK228_05665 [Nitrososphaerales archaeon]|nr:hypothetical protein [Nitrososphaerales archaeon]